MISIPSHLQFADVADSTTVVMNFQAADDFDKFVSELRPNSAADE
jgi:hypothetical protein